MKNITTFLLLFFALLNLNGFAQRIYYSELEKHGNVLNVGIGVGGYTGYYGLSGHTLPVFNINYEFDVLNDVTLAPFATIYSYRDEIKHYRETIIPVGIKGSVYFDQLFNTNTKWDIYLAGSVGYSITNASWDQGYSGETYYQDVSPLFLDLHLGTEYHISNRIGILLELSTGVSTIGLAFHRL